MKKIILSLLFLANILPIFAQNEYNIIPIPQKLEAKIGVFTMNEKTLIVGNPAIQEVAELLNTQLNNAGGWSKKVQINTSKKINNAIQFIQNESISEEGYQLEITPKQVLISSKTPKGAFYGVQTLLQLLPTEIFKDSKTEGIKWTIPCCKIEDAQGIHIVECT